MEQIIGPEKGRRAGQAFGFVFAIFAGILVLYSAATVRAQSRMPPSVAAVLERVQNAFATASRSDPEKTPGLISLRRAAGLRNFLPNDSTQDEYRLLYDGDLVFLIGMKSFLGLHYVQRLRSIALRRTFHLQVLGESWNGKRKKVSLLLGDDPLLEPFEISPEMLLKVLEHTLHPE